MTTQGTSQLNNGFTQSLNDAIRENPVSAGLVGLGLVWMALEGSKASTISSKLPGAARAATEAIGSATHATGNAVGGALRGTGAFVKDTTRKIGEKISSTSEGAAHLVRDTVSSAFDAVTPFGDKPSEPTAEQPHAAGRPSTTFGEIGTSIQQNLRRNLERQPVLLGVIGLAIGAGIASAFPSTNLEKDVMGDAGAVVKEKLQQFATDATERTKQVFDTVKDEARTQGLTPDAVKESVKEVAEKVKNVASFSRQSLKDRLS